MRPLSVLTQAPAQGVRQLDLSCGKGWGWGSRHRNQQLSLARTLTPKSWPTGTPLGAEKNHQLEICSTPKG